MVYSSQVIKGYWTKYCTFALFYSTRQNRKANYGRKIPLTLNGPLQKSQTGFSGTDFAGQLTETKQRKLKQQQRKGEEQVVAGGGTSLVSQGVSHLTHFHQTLTGEQKDPYKPRTMRWSYWRGHNNGKWTHLLFVVCPPRLDYPFTFLLEAIKSQSQVFYRGKQNYTAIGSLPPPRMLMFEGLYEESTQRSNLLCGVYTTHSTYISSREVPTVAR